MTAFRTLGPGSFECLETDCPQRVTTNAAAHAIRQHGSKTVVLGAPEATNHTVIFVDEEPEGFPESLTEEILEPAPSPHLVTEATLANDEKPKVVYFGRKNFHGEHADQAPKMHINKLPYTGKYGDFEGYCGYSRRNILGDLIISRSKRPPHREVLCKVCVTNLKDLS